MKTTTRLSLLLGALSLFALPAHAQYFGRNAVQYETFHFKILKTQHFDVYFYDKEAQLAAEAGRMAERWYTRLSTVLRHQLSGRQPLIIYADAPDFQQTNVLGQQPGEGTGGVTESLKRRIILPAGASLRETDHVIGHELTHAFQYDITGVGRGSMATGGLNQVPLWFIEGMAEYMSLGPIDPNTTMWMRDAVRRGDLPNFRDLENPKYFPYRWGQSLWAYLGGTYGDDIVGALLRAAGRTGNVQGALEQMTHRPADSTIADWHRALIEAAQPVAVATGVQIPADRKHVPRELQMPVTATGARLLISPGKEEHYNLAPALSPDGKRVVYFSDAGLFSIDMYLADAQSGRTIRKLVSSTRDPHLESLQFINSAGAWDADGGRFVFGAVITGKPALEIVNGSGDVVKQIKFPSLGEIFNPTWSPDGKMIAFSAQVGGVTDLFTYDLDSGKLQQLTQDLYADLEPAWSPDGSQIAFVTDRFGTSLDKLVYGDYELAVIDARTGGTVRELPHLANAKHINPQWSPDGKELYFLADPGGITNVYRLSLADSAITQVTNIFTGVAGITSLSPALSVAQKTPKAVFTVYTGGGYAIQVMEDVHALAGGPVKELPKSAAMLPPIDREAGVATLISDPSPGLPAEGTVALSTAIKAYRPKMSLDYVSRPSLAVAADRFGTYVGGGITLYWSDMLGDRDLVTMAQVNGRVKDFAALVAYENRKSRWNWGVAAQWIPYITGGVIPDFTTFNGQTVYVESLIRFKQTTRALTGVVAYPFNRSRRLELSAGVQNITFSESIDSNGVFYPSGQFAFHNSVDIPTFPGITEGVGSVALVNDNSFFGATSPILGNRWRLEADPSFGTLNFITALADYRKYVMPFRPFTLAGRVLHVGRYGHDADDNRMYPLFIGYPSLVRGYDVGSFSASECGSSTGSCPVFDQLVGSKILVANGELRFPPLGLLHLGGGYYGFLPIEAALFYDAGVAWTASEGAQLFGNGPRKIVRSTGVSLRMNLFGYAIGQMDVVHPFDRPEKNWMVRFSITEGY